MANNILEQTKEEFSEKLFNTLSSIEIPSEIELTKGKVLVQVKINDKGMILDVFDISNG